MSGRTITTAPDEERDEPRFEALDVGATDTLDPDALFRELFRPSAIRRTASQVRREVRQIRNRDVIDWTDVFVTLDSHLPELSRQILGGQFVPSPPTRYELAKAKGAFRTMTSLNMLDAVIYRHLANTVLARAIPFKVGGAFYSRRFQRTPVGTTLTITNDDHYVKFYDIWLRYQQYRSQTLMANAYEKLVVTDISNFFESIQHDLLLEYIAPYGLPRKATALLARLLEALRPAAGHSPNPRVGIPTDELDCSRQLAHVFLFEHDRDVVQQVGEGNYVRWMDDHNIGATNDTDARRVVNLLTRSLSERKLTLNSGKTAFLSPEQVALHFQLESNTDIDDWEQKHRRTVSLRPQAARADFLELWRRVRTGPSVGIGNWDKILKRMYAGAVRVDTRRLESRALNDLIMYPDLDERIFTYFAARNRGAALLDLFSTYCRRGENLFEGTEAAFFQSVLRLSPGPQLRARLLSLCEEFARGTASGACRRPLGRANALLALYWLGAPPATIQGLYSPDEARRLPKEIARTWLACAAALDPESKNAILARLFGHPSDDVVRLAGFLDSVISGRVTNLGYYRSRRSRWPSPGDYYDARSWLVLEIASHAPNEELKGRALGDVKLFAAYARSTPERSALRRIRTNLKASMPREAGTGQGFARMSAGR